MPVHSKFLPIFAPQQQTVKNKHLIFLFLATLVVGLLLRAVPWQFRATEDVPVIELDTAEVTQIIVKSPRPQYSLVYDRTEAGWTVTNDHRTIIAQSLLVSKLLQGLQKVYPQRAVAAKNTDEHQFSPAQAIEVQVFNHHKILTHFWIGQDADAGRTSAWVKLERYDEAFVIPLQKWLWEATLNGPELRSSAIVQMFFEPQKIRSFALLLPGRDSFYFRKNDTLGLWDSPDQYMLSDELTQAWFWTMHSELKGGFADNFDETAARKSLFAEIVFNAPTSNPPVQTFQIFSVPNPNVPEDPVVLKDGYLSPFSPFVIHASSNPQNYFGIDSTIVKKICLEMLQSNQQPISKYQQ